MKPGATVDQRRGCELAADHQRRQRARRNLLDQAVAELVRLANERGAELASGDFGVVLNLDRGEHRRIQLYEVRTVTEPVASGQ